MKKEVATLITLTCQWEARNLRSSKSQLYIVVNRTFTIMYNYCKSLNSFTWRYANIFCATCNGELAAVQRQTIKIGKTDDPSFFVPQTWLLAKDAPTSICFVLVALTFVKTFFNLSSMFPANSVGWGEMIYHSKTSGTSFFFRHMPF